MSEWNSGSTNHYNLQDYVLPGPAENKSDYYFANINDYDDVGLGGNAEINEINNNDVITYPSNLNILKNMDDLLDIVSFHSELLYPKYEILQSYYQGKHISIIDADNKPNNKPDARKIINLPKRLTDSFNGYFSGNATQVTLTSNDENENNLVNPMIDNYLASHNFWDVSADLNRMASIYGRSYLYAYYDRATSDVKLVPLSPLDTIVVYDDTVLHRPMFAIRYSQDDDNTFEGTVITKSGEYDFSPSQSRTSNRLTIDDNRPRKDKNGNPNQSPVLPVIEQFENKGRVSIFGDCISLIDSIDKVESQKENDLLSLSNAYLVVKGAELSDKDIDRMARSHVIDLYTSKFQQIGGNNHGANSDTDVKFLAPNINDNLQEHVLDRDISQVYQVAQVVDLSDPKSVASAQTATEIQQLYGNMKAKARVKDARFNVVLRKLFTLLFNVWGIDPKYIGSLQFHHQFSTPTNDLQEAQAYAQIANTNLPTAVKLSFLPGHVQNAQEMADQMDQSKQQRQSSIASQVRQAVKQVQPQVQQNSGDNNVQQNDSQEQNQSTDASRPSNGQQN